jgi:hypothetical protein
MRGILMAIIIVTLGMARPAAAIETCRDMLMPLTQLKQVSRGLSRYHAGLDLIAPYGSPVRAADAGTVIFAGRFFGYGNVVDIRHADGLMTRYAHLSAFAAGIRPGVQVTTGEQIGLVGATGFAHGAHLHFEVRENGRPLDPKPFIHLANCVRTGPDTPHLEEARAPEQPINHALVDLPPAAPAGKEAGQSGGQ